MTIPNGVEVESVAEAEKALHRLRRVEIAAVSVALVAALAALGVCIWLVALVRDCTVEGGECYEKNRRSSLQFRDEIQTLIRDNAECNVLQLLEHRDANERAHGLNAGKHGYVYAAPAGEVPPPIPEALLAACDQFIPRNQGGKK